MCLIEMNPPLLHELKSFRAFRAGPRAVDSMFGKLMSLPKLSRGEHQEFVFTTWVGADIGLEICKHMTPGIIRLALDIDQILLV
jgi:hypothetical protein